MEHLKRLENECENEYIARLYKNKIEYGLTNKEVCEILNRELGYNKAESTYRSIAYPFIEGFENGYDKALSEVKSKNIENTVEEDDFIQQLKEEKRQIKEERYKLQTEKLENNKLIRESARINLYLERMEQSILNLQPLEIPNPIEVIDNEKVLLLNIADPHVGKQGIVRGLKGEILNEYNFEIFKERMWKLFNETLHIIKKERIEHVYLLCEGDFVEGILRQSQLQGLEMGVVDSVIEVSEFLANYINELSNYVYVSYHSAYGNHDGLRLLQAKSAKDFPHENVDKFIDFYLEKRLENNKNVYINNNQLPYSFFSVYGMNIMVTHGEEKNLSQLLKDYTLMYNEKIDLILAGHLHSSSVEGIGIGTYGDVEVIRIPSICGIDDFCVSTVHKFSRAGSKVMIIENGKGKTITYDISLN